MKQRPRREVLKAVPKEERVGRLRKPPPLPLSVLIWTAEQEREYLHGNGPPPFP